ncbi:MAG: hypothetical protein DME70_04430 [Verrucomicrobia bacterium]|nr:MAG: hypothetical protein DME70_04430 [Verrucomicrobiota bacterium]
MDERPEKPGAALAGHRAGRVSCRLLGPPRLARSVRGENLDRAAGGLFRALEKGERLYAGFVLDGKEWQYGKLPEAATETPGVLKITVNGDRVTATFKASPSAAGRYDIHVARLGFSLTADVTAGENNGRKMSHDFVVLGLTNETMKAGTKELQLPASSTKSTIDPRTAIAAWITPTGQIEPIQAVGGWLP